MLISNKRDNYWQIVHGKEFSTLGINSRRYDLKYAVNF
jgi:hypothetical protein